MASTEETCPSTGPCDEYSAAVDSPHGERRRRAHELLARQREQIDRLENELAEQLQHALEEVAQSAQIAEAAASEGESAALAALQAQFEELKRQYAALDGETEQLRTQLEQAQVQLGRAEQELRVRETLLKEAQSDDEQRHVELATVRERLADAEAQLTAARERQGTLERELVEVRERAEAEREETKAQRRRIAREFRQQHAERIAEFDRRKAELAALADTRDGRLVEQLSEAQAELLANVRELDEAREALAERTAELEQAQRSIETLQSGSGVDADVLQLQQERDQLAQRLSEAEAALAQGGAEETSQDRDDLQRRFEMAVEEVRELKTINAQLETKLKARGGAPAAPATGMDWEAQKQRLLASLEADDDDSDEATEERTSIEGTIRITDQVVAQKDEEIAELKRLLEQNGEASTATNRTKATTELLDSDDIIRQEREKLAQIQAEWREKIGQAEIDISLQRAKIARDRAELDEKLRQIEAHQESSGSTTDAADPAKPTRGRWLARLGLNADEQK